MHSLTAAAEVQLDRQLTWRTKGEHARIAVAVARQPPVESDVLSEEELKQVRHNLAHLSTDGVRQFYERAHEECRMVHDGLPTPRMMQTLVQVWKQLWKCKESDFLMARSVGLCIPSKPAIIEQVNRVAFLNICVLLRIGKEEDAKKTSIANPTRQSIHRRCAAFSDRCAVFGDIGVHSLAPHNFHRFKMSQDRVCSHHTKFRAESVAMHASSVNAVPSEILDTLHTRGAMPASALVESILNSESGLSDTDVKMIIWDMIAHGRIKLSPDQLLVLPDEAG
jgi:hypothetical protein